MTRDLPSSPGRRPRWRRRVLLLALLTLGAAGVWGTVSWQRLEAQALDLAETGQGAIQLLSSQAKAIANHDIDALAAVYASGYDGLVLGDWDETEAFRRDGITVRTWRAKEGGTGSTTDRLQRFLDSLHRIDHSKLKLASVEESGDGTATIRSVLWLRGATEDGTHFEMHGTLRFGLRYSEDRWQIADQALVSGETVFGPGTAFEEVALASGLDFVAQQNPNFRTPEWEPKKFGILKYGSAGVSAADYDGDGWDDLFFADGADSRLYRNQADDTFRDVTEEVGLPTPLVGVNVALFVDLDNDGDQDLFLGVFTGPNRLFENDGQGHYRDVTDQANLGGSMVTVASAADYDRDGLLDLYVGRYLDPRTELPDTLFYTRNGEGNSLLRNLGGLRFEDVTDRAGVREGGLTLGVAWADYDDDGDDDLYVANDFGRNALLRNEGDGTFRDVSEATNSLDFGFGMSATWGDIDNDGDFDLYTSNVHSGQRWYGQAATLQQYLLTSIRQGTIFEDYPLYREIYGYAGSDWRDYGDRMVKGNSLLVLGEDGRFEDISERAHTNPYGWYWGSGMLDYDYDGRLDIYAANGWITGRTTDDL